MKKAIFMYSLFSMLILGGINTTFAQDEKSEKEDSVSIDDADPVYYDAEEDEGSGSGSTGIILAIVGGIVVVGIGSYLFLRNRKK